MSRHSNRTSSRPGPRAGSRSGSRGGTSRHHRTPPSNGDTSEVHVSDAEPAERPLAGDVDAAISASGAAAVIERFGTGLDSKVLVLNRLYMAIRVVSARRAFVMLAKELAEVIHVEEGKYVNYDFGSWCEVAAFQREFEAQRHDWVRTVRAHIAVPRIVRLLGYDRLPEQNVKLNRRNLFARDRNQCQYCGKHYPTSDLSVDHVLPRAQGGGESWENLVCACIWCNARKGGRTPEQASMRLVRPAKRPRRNPLITLRLGSEKYQSWKAFLDEAYWSVELR